MTTVACWLNKAENVHRLWAIADTKISRPSQDVLGNPTYSLLLNCGSKLFTLNIKCKKGHCFGDVYFEHSIGMAYAGSSLIALNIYATLVNILDNLISSNNTIPSILDISVCVQKLLKLMAYQVGEISRSHESAKCEIALFGFCHVTQQFKIFHLETVTSYTSLDIISTEGIIEDDDYFLLLGQNKKDISQLIKEKRNECAKTDFQWWNAPEIVIKQLIEEEKYQTIGGSIQRGMATQLGFKLFSYVFPVVKGKPETQILYQNIDIYQEIPLIGNCFIGIPGMV